MHINFSSADKNFIKTEVSSGTYISEEELIRVAVQHMREEKEQKQRFSEAVAKGTQAIMRGEIVLLTSDLLREIKLEAIHKAKNDSPYSTTDAIPKTT
ncbi:MAG: hypothetical protein AABY33_07980 [Pseudomonadota bacterium]